MTIDSLIHAASPAVGMVISLFVLHSWFNKPYSSAIQEMRHEMKHISSQLTEIKLDMARIYVTKDELTEALYSVRKEQEEIKKKLEDYFYRKNNR